MPRFCRSRALWGLAAACVMVLGAPWAGCAWAQTPDRDRHASAEPSIQDTGALLQKAADALAQGRLNDAQSALDGAKAVNPTQLGLWALYGELKVQQGNAAGAVADLRRELELHPEFLPTYRALAGAQVASGDQAGAAATLRAWQKAEPAAPEPLASLLGLLMDEGKPAEAVKAGEDGLQKLPEDARSEPALMLRMGSVELKVGNREKGVPMLEAAMRGGDANVKNSAAYLLAEAGADLPQAEAVERDLLERLSLVSEGWTLGENILTLLGQSEGMAAAWDTMGWIQFREGKLAEAERYVRAAWRNDQHAAIGEHLGEIEAARGNHRAALGAFEIALAASQPRAGAHVSPEETDTIALLKQRIAAEEKNGTRTEVTDPAAALARLRTFNLGPAGGKTGEAQYRVLFGRGKVVRVLTALRGGKDLAGVPAMMMRMPVADFFPTEDYSQLVHLGLARCDGKTCQFTIQN